MIQTGIPLIPLADVKDLLGLGPDGLDDDSFDTALTSALPLITARFERYCDRGLAQRTITLEQYFNDYGYARIYTWAYPIVSLTSVKFDGVVQNLASYTFNPDAGYLYPAKNVGSTAIRCANLIEYAYVAGFAPDAVPEELALAYAQACGAHVGVSNVVTTGDTGGGSGAIKSIGLGSGALSVAFDTGVVHGGFSGSYDVSNVPVELQHYAWILDPYKRGSL